MYRNSTFLQIVVISLTLIAGVFIGFMFADFDIPIKWNAEFKLGDLIAALVALLTFVFAYKGIEDNRKTIELSFKPALFQHFSFNSADYIFSIELKNAGIGAAHNCTYKYFIDEEEVFDKELDDKIKGFLRNKESQVHLSKGQVIFSNDVHTIFRLNAVEKDEYEMIKNFLLYKFSYSVTYTDGLEKHYEQEFKPG